MTDGVHVTDRAAVALSVFSTRPIAKNKGVNMSKVTEGRILVAHPQLPDAFFSRNVILIVSDKPGDGTIGVNIACTPRPDGFTLGGPVPGLALLVRKITDETKDKLTPLADTGYGITDIGQETPDGPLEPADLLAMPDSTKLLGYAGWGDGQLDTEISMRGWGFSPRTLDEIMAQPPEQRYQFALAGAQFAE